MQCHACCSPTCLRGDMYRPLVAITALMPLLLGPPWCSHQRSRQGPYSEGDAVPAGISLLEMPQPSASNTDESQQQLLPLSCRAVSLESLAAGPRPLVLLAGSWS